jgi:hypothetical protein
MNQPYLSFYSSSQYLLHTLERESQVLDRRLLRFLDKAVQQAPCVPAPRRKSPARSFRQSGRSALPTGRCRDYDYRACRAASRIRPSECPGPPLCDLPRLAPGPTPGRAGCRGRIRRRTPEASSERSINLHCAKNGTYWQGPPALQATRSAFGGSDRILQSAGRSLQPFRSWDSAAPDNRPHGSQRKHAATVIGNDDLLSGEWMPPLLVAPGSADPQKAVMAKNSDHLV